MNNYKENIKLRESNNFSNANKCLEYIITLRKDNIRKSTQKGDKALLNHLNRFCNYNIYLESIDSEFCHKFSEYLINEVMLKINSTKTYLQKLHAILEEAEHLGFIKHNPMVSLKKILPHYIPREKENLNIEEIQLIEKIDCKHNSTKIAFIFACYTGLRLSDIETLRWSDIRKQGNYYLIVKVQIKTDKEVRIPLCKQAINILNNLRSSRKISNENDYIFSLYSRTTIYNDLKEIEVKTKIKKHLTFHVSRITFVTLSISAGINIYVISKLCGHQDIKTTQIYTRMTDTTYINAINRLENYFKNSNFMK
ncbi:MAG: tyrosine-type recombinase/integrase [Bacteroidales bacterium]|nr:tyrosine-type recombinase/integrase [Bacteroidales bacterium]